MEPMTLGSPTHSPSGSPNVGYLPPFLLGEMNAPATPRINSLSPTKGRTLAFAGSPSSSPQGSTLDQKSYRQNLSLHQHGKYSQQNQYHNVYNSPQNSYNLQPSMVAQQNISYSNKPNTGPPIEDLFDTIKSNDSFAGYSNSNSFMQNSFQGNSHNLLAWQEESPEVEGYWVTVFGFPANAANTVLARFSNCGAILDKHYPTQGNWAHIRYATRSEKERALALNGRQVLPGIMVGVTDCKDPPRISVSSPNGVLNVSERQVVARSLCPTPLATAPVPQKSNGLVSKALDYVFGW